MSNLDFPGLRRDLEAAVRQPSFEAIRARQHRRTRRLVLTGTAALTVVALTLGTVVYLSSRGSAPVGHTPTPTASSGLPARVGALTATPSGAWLAMSLRCVSNCGIGPESFAQTLVRSDDHGQSWTTVSRLPDGGDTVPQLLAGSDTALWLASGTTVYGSSDAGRNWQRWSLVPKDVTPSGAEPVGFVAGGTAWWLLDGQVFTARDGKQPVPTSARPPAAVANVAGAGGDRALAALHGIDTTRWFVTSDRGATWSATANPCTATSYPLSQSVAVRNAPDGSLWATCYADMRNPAASEFATSVDGGITWQAHGTPPPDRGDDLRPVSAMVAWHMGAGPVDSGPYIYRTIDGGTQWTAVRNRETDAPDPSAEALFVAIDTTTAAYTTATAGGGDLLTVTTDGGRTWTTRPFTT